MKREAILFYMQNDKIYIYLSNVKKEIIEKLDTSLLFKYGEISNIKAFRNTIESIIDKNKLLGGILKPNIMVLYNDITNCDLKFLYEIGLEPFSYNKITFFALSELIKEISKNDNIIFFDKDYYTIFKNCKKIKNIDNLDFEPIIIGSNKENNLHYSGNDIIWNKFKTHFTKD